MRGGYDTVMPMLLLAAALSLSLAPAQGEDWVFVSSTASGVTFVDADSLVSDGDIRTIDVLAVARVDTDGVAAERGPVSFDCKTGHRRIEAGVSYDLDGKVLRHLDAGSWREVRPGTLHALMRDRLCAGASLTGERFGARMPIRAARSAMDSERIREGVLQ
jgi:hypothetical protein